MLLLILASFKKLLGNLAINQRALGVFIIEIDRHTVAGCLGNLDVTGYGLSEHKVREVLLHLIEYVEVQIESAVIHSYNYTFLPDHHH